MTFVTLVGGGGKGPVNGTAGSACLAENSARHLLRAASLTGRLVDFADEE